MNKLLHTPLTVHNVELANRLVMPPMATGKTPDGTVQDDLLAYYDARSKGGCIGLIVTEHAYVSPEGKAHEGQLSVSRDTDIPGLTKLVETIHKNNTRVIAQINHAGSAAMEEITGYPAISASVTAQPEYARKSEKPVREMTADDMHTVAKKFAEAALRVKEAGFDGVEIHAAHGYLLDQFYSPLGNKRTDAYGGDLDGRIHLLLDVIRAVREAVGADDLVALRLGASDYTEGGATIDDAVYACKKFEKAPMKGKAEGTVVSTMPLSYQGNLIENFSITFKGGRAVSCKAEKNQELLEHMIAMDEGAAQIGELALIPNDSPISNLGILFYNTLFDENASCHIALGLGFPNVIKDYDKYTLDEIHDKGVNDSVIHVDFMVGDATMNIDGITPDGEVIPVFRNGNWTEKFM